MKEDPLRGLSARQREEHELHCARYFATYKPGEHTGWLAEELGARRLVVAERIDLDHAQRPGATQRHDCVDCGANLQHEPQMGCDFICLACAYRRASFDC